MSRSRRCMIYCQVVMVVACAGCGGGGKMVNSGRAAENRGEPHVAFEQYCRAAADHPGSGEVAASLERVRPGASAYWESQALLAMDGGQYAEAWRMLMKALEIQPDSADTAQLIRQVQSGHGDQIAAARAEWMRRGTAALASVASESRRSAAKQAASGNRPAAPEPAKPSKTVETSQPPIASKEAADTSKADSRIVAPTREASVAVNESPAQSDEQTKDSAIQSAEQSSEARKLRRPSLANAADDFLTVQTLSLKDRSHPRSIEIVDGVEVRLKDTEEDLEADLDLYAGKNRVKKIRNIKIGRSQVFAGRSGNLYRLTLLGIHHKSRTVRIGIKPA